MNKIRFSLKTKLLLFSITILLIPWIGYKYVRGMESFLKASLEDSQATRAQAVSAVLQQQPELITSQTRIVDINNSTQHLYLRPLKTQIQLDGYTEDWALNQDLFQYFGEQNIIRKSPTYKPGSIHFTHATGSYKHYLYAVFKVTDDHVVYLNTGSQNLDRADHLRIALQAPSGKLHRYYLSTAAPGRLNAHLMSNNPDEPSPLRDEYRIQGAWQQTADGYTIEIRIPLSMIGRKLSFAIGDIDHVTDTSATIIGTSGTEHLSGLATIMVPSTKLDHLLQKLSRGSSRIWIVDKNKRVLALAGNLSASGRENNSDRSVPAMILSALYRLILQQPVSNIEDSLSAVSKLKGREIDSALNGTPATSWRQTSQKNATILTTTYPIRLGNKIIGAVMMEQNSNRILLLQNQAMEELLNLSIPIFLGGTLIILFFAGRLTTRISQLRNQTEQAISSEGKISNVFVASDANDEIGDLSRGFSDLLSRLHQYNRYLETMAGKLSHELRTPLTIVRSSLDNLEQVRPETGNDTYMKRAKEGLERLNNILNRLSEATRLEQALQQTEKEEIDLSNLVRNCVDSYRSGYPNNHFKLEAHEQTQHIMAAPDLIVQLLDKLVCNAIDFSAEKDPIRISITGENNNRTVLRVCNQGPLLPAEMQENLFDSMISLRKEKTVTPHLGLGLYIVRLITEYHQGTVYAKNLTNPDGVEFTLSFPVKRY